MKTCSCCNLKKLLNEFDKDKRTKDGYITYCKECRKLKDRNYYVKNKERIKYDSRIRNKKHRDKIGYEGRKDYYLKWMFNITLEDYNTMLEQQDNKCCICKINYSKTYHVDHCHTTNKVRGLLCDQCNKGLGHFKDNIDYLQSAIKYLGDDK